MSRASSAAVVQLIPWALAGVALAAFGLWAWRRGGIAPAVADLTGGAVRAAGGVVDGVVTGVVTTAGEAVGVPRTDADQCARDLAAGRTWDASFSCPAGRFIGSQWDRMWGAGGATGTDAAAPSSGAAQPYQWTEASGTEGKSFEELAGQSAVWWPSP